VTEDVDPDFDTLLETSGTLTIVDPDPGESSFQAATINGIYGDLTIDVAGNWAYSADNTQAAIQALGVGETLIDTLTVATFDGTTHDITITINGADDAPVIGGTSIGAVTEDGALTASDNLTITDVDTSDNPISFNNVIPTLGDNGYGNFEITGNTWSYTLNNGHASVQALDVGETLNDTFTYTATDSSTQVVIVTITGTEDAPTVNNAIGDRVAIENSPFGFTIAANTFVDPDTSDTLTYTATLADNSALPAWLTFNPGTLNFSGTPVNADIGAIDVKVSADDGSSTITDTFEIAVINATSPVVVPPVTNPDPGEPTGGNNPPVQIIEPITGGGSGEETIQPEDNEIISTVSTVGTVTEESFSNLEEQIETLLGQTNSTNTVQDGKFNHIPANQQQVLQDQLTNQAKLGSLFDSDNNLVDEHERKLWNQMDAMNQQMSDDASRDDAQLVEAQIVIGSTMGLTAGFIGWVLRGGSLLASMMSSVSVLGSFDPLPILKKSSERENVTADDEDKDSKDDTDTDSTDDTDKDSKEDTDTDSTDDTDTDPADKADELFTGDESK
jgi:VCBS repeat-containing protein